MSRPMIVALAAATGYALWRLLERREGPRSLAWRRDEIEALLEEAGAVAPGLAGTRLWMIGFRSCPDCIRYVDQELPRLLAAGIDTAVLFVPRRDQEGVARSTAAERATVAELMVRPDWDLFRRWTASALEDWTADDLPAADGDPAREALIERRRRTMDALRPLLAANGLEVGPYGPRYPTLIWRSASGALRACVCEDPATYRLVTDELGVA